MDMLFSKIRELISPRHEVLGCRMICALYREDAKKARGGVRKVKGRVVQIVFADKRPSRGKHKPELEGEREGDESEEDSGSDYETRTEGETATIATIKHNKPKSERREAR